jgi:hypothetical protein
MSYTKAVRWCEQHIPHFNDTFTACLIRAHKKFDPAYYVLSGDEAFYQNAKYKAFWDFITHSNREGAAAVTAAYPNSAIARAFSMCRELSRKQSHVANWHIIKTEALAALTYTENNFPADDTHERFMIYMTAIRARYPLINDILCDYEKNSERSYYYNRCTTLPVKVMVNYITFMEQHYSNRRFTPSPEFREAIIDYAHAIEGKHEQQDVSSSHLRLADSVPQRTDDSGRKHAPELDGDQSGDQRRTV